MRRRPARLFRALCATVLAMGIAGTSAIAVQPAALDSQGIDEFAISTEAYGQNDPCVADGVIYWEDNRFYGGMFPVDDIRSHDVSTGEETLVVGDGGVLASDPNVHGNWLVYEHANVPNPSDVMLANLANGSVVTVSADPSLIEEQPDVYGDTVVYEAEVPLGTDIHGYTISTGTTFTISASLFRASDPAIWNSQIVWSEDSPITGYDIKTYDLLTGTSASLVVAPGRQGEPQIHDSFVVWEDSRASDDDIYAYDLSTDTTLAVCVAPGDQREPDVWGDVFVWSDDRNGDYDIYGYDLSADKTFVICDAPGDQDDPSIDGGIVAWEDGRTGGEDDVFAADIRRFVDRVWGTDRYLTAAALSESQFSAETTAVIATGRMFPDALAASGLAGAYECPLLLTRDSSLPSATADELARLGVTDVILVGGTGAIGEAVESTLDDLGYTVDRIAGTDRYATAAKIAERVASVSGGAFGKQVFVARGDTFPDGLAVAPFAYSQKMPVVLVRPTALPSSAAEILTTLDIQGAVIAGGTGAVGSNVQTAVDALLTANSGASSLRWSGSTRYETAAEIARRGAAVGWGDFGYVGIATGKQFPDALTGGATAGAHGGVMLLSDGKSLVTSAENLIRYETWPESFLEVYGGTGAQTETVLESAKTKANMD